MDDGRFDHLARSLAMRRSRRAVTALLGGAVAGPALLGAEIGAKGKGKGKGKKKKRKKTCAKSCPSGCCTGKYGACILPSQQSATRCGSGGAICRGTGCPACTEDRPCPAGQCCRGDDTCGACLVFVTSARQDGNLGGVAGGDAICSLLARNAGLPGTYLAWLSDATSSPSSRFTRAIVPYTLVDGTIIAENWTALIGGPVNNPINRTETGMIAAGASRAVWTGTNNNGTAAIAAARCVNWSTADPGIRGAAGDWGTTAQWTDDAESGCGFSGALYCFQQR